MRHTQPALDCRNGFGKTEANQTGGSDTETSTSEADDRQTATGPLVPKPSASIQAKSDHISVFLHYFNVVNIWADTMNPIAIADRCYTIHIRNTVQYTPSSQSTAQQKTYTVILDLPF